MSLESLSDPLPGESPAGEDCQSEIESQNLALMTEYLVERTLQKARERAADRPDLEEGEARNAAAVRDDGKRRLSSLEGILKDVLKVSAISVEQVATVLRNKASSLLAQRGKDLRVLPHLAAASVLVDGLSGYADTLKLAAALLQTYPKELFPLPDEDNPTDVWERANAVSELMLGDGMRALLGPVVVVDARQAGRLTLAELVGGLRDDVAVPEAPQAHLEMALAELGLEQVQQLLGTFRDIDAAVAGLVPAIGGNAALPAPRVAETFKRAAARIASFASGTPAEQVPANAALEPPRAPGVAARATVGLQTREDARRAIQDLVRFIERIEPGHPAPLLLKRADRLLGMGFIEIIKDMAPNALSDISQIAGAEPSGQ